MVFFFYFDSEKNSEYNGTKRIIILILQPYFFVLWNQKKSENIQIYNGMSDDKKKLMIQQNTSKMYNL
jgi:hypothetical protein